MNPLISPTNSLFLPLNQLSPHCNRLLNSLHDGCTSRSERVLFEQTLWNEVKKIRALNDTSIFLYLIGYYHIVLYQVEKSTAQDDLFHYHVLIRLGDLNRYVERTDVAEYYYCNARNLFPFYGQAYNQLGLLTKPTNCYKCCYYYARAARSSDKPVNTIADSNLRIAVSRYNCEILNHILNDQPSLNDDGDIKYNNLPQTAFEWFNVIVVAIYADNIQPIARMFLCFMNENFSTQKDTTLHGTVQRTTIYCDRESYILLASLDILLDWLNLGSRCKELFLTLSTEFRQIKSCLNSIIHSYQSKESVKDRSIDCSETNSITSAIDSHRTRLSGNSMNSDSTLQDSTQASTIDTSGSLNSSKPAALPHDYVLRGFNPLNSIHQELTFKRRVEAVEDIDDNSIGAVKSNRQNFIDTEILFQISVRLKSKLDGFGPLLRRKTRNIALESILSNMNRDDHL